MNLPRPPRVRPPRVRRQVAHPLPRQGPSRSTHLPTLRKARRRVVPHTPPRQGRSARRRNGAPPTRSLRSRENEGGPKSRRFRLPGRSENADDLERSSRTGQRPEETNPKNAGLAAPRRPKAKPVSAIPVLLGPEVVCPPRKGPRRSLRMAATKPRTARALGVAPRRCS